MKTYLYALAAVVCLLIAHVVGSTLNLYVRTNFYDIPMHILGGFGLGLFFTALILSTQKKNIRARAVVILCVFIAGVIWELFEAYYNIAGYPVGTKLYWIDTVKDVVDDIIGGSIAAWAMSARLASGATASTTQTQ